MKVKKYCLSICVAMALVACSDNADNAQNSSNPPAPATNTAPN